MKELFVVNSVCDGKITASPCLSDRLQDSGASMPKADRDKKYHIEVLNPKGLQITEGCYVYVRFFKNLESLRGIAALILPVAAAVLGFASSPFIAATIHNEPTEFFKAICVSVCFLIAATLVFILTRKIHTEIHPHIIEICKKDSHQDTGKTTI